jgi:hypothetical protein
MPLIKATFTDSGRLWLARTLAGKDETLPVASQFKTSPLYFYRVGEGGYQTLPSLQKIPIAPSSRIDKNGIVAGKGLKDASLSLLNPDAAPPADIVVINAAEVPDVDQALFFAQKDIAPADMSITLVSGTYTLTVVTTLEMDEANKTFAAQGGASPNFFEIGLFVRYTLDGSAPIATSPSMMIAYGTFSVETKINTNALINDVIFEI